MKMRRFSKHNSNQKQWLTTFSDMVLIMLVFFIMLFSISVVDAQRFQELIDSFQGQDILDQAPSIVAEDMEESTANIDDGQGHDTDAEEDELEALVEEVEGYIERNELEDMITATREARGVKLVLQDRLLFDTGEAYILDEAEPFLDETISILEELPYTVEVEGHTDDRPINTYRYPSNWELSTARASSVIRYFAEEGDLERSRFVATGYGDTQPVVSNDSSENMQENRRVVIFITDPDFEDENEQAALFEELPIFAFLSFHGGCSRGIYPGFLHFFH
ncbi:flagellar motor protein MotS [Natribacillus halophilus]|uniref:Chemotaxis protein MotB n=1 Tax=Natribacillus halophilus TaxID=549003 RepID=A0A1G8NEY6_9BACI|nr:flagellar motor protein MotS [Natribacillus halophilus]SDI78814.1 chemotaxis protein MotB [Natribacillus halophilus]